VTEAFSPGLENVAAARTTVSFLDLERECITVRGYDLIELARIVHLPDVAHLLIRGHLPNLTEQASFCGALATASGLPEGIVDIMRRLPRETSPMDALRTGLSLLAEWEDPHVLLDPSPEASEAKAIRLLARGPSLTANGWRAIHGQPTLEPNPGLGFAGSFLWMIQGRAPDLEAVSTFDRVLTCYSEHEMAASTFAARVVASTMADVYGAVVAACAALKGPLHGGANEAAARMFAEIRMRGGAAAAEAYVMEQLWEGHRIMGFGHRVYMRRPDPRAVLMKEELDALAARDPEARAHVDAYEIVAATMEREKGLYPNADLPIGLVLLLIGVPVELFTPIFMCARIAGGAAHVIEQQANNRLYRPRVDYVGPADASPSEGFEPSRC
jgi:citrate synthase